MYILGIQHVCIALGCNTFSLPDRSFWPSFCAGEKSFIHAPASNRLVTLGISIPPAPTSKFTWFICAHLGWPAARKWEQLYCPNWTEGNWLVSGGDCLDWPVCSRKMLRQHLSTWDSLLIGKWCHCVQVWESGRRRAAWANRKGRSLNVMMLQTAARPSWRIFV